jgi:type IV secretory pathway VirB3-like protein
MSLLHIVFFLIFIGVPLYLFNRYITKIDPNIKQIINVVAG